MPLEKKRTGTAGEKRNCWSRGKGAYSYRGELKRGLSLNKKLLNRKVRRNSDVIFKGNDYRKICKTIYIEKFT